MQPEKVTVWCVLWASGIIESYFFKGAANRKVTTNGERYREMISNFFLPKMQKLNLVVTWFQQDEARCHTVRLTGGLLKGEVGEHFISSSGPVNGTHRSCDLTPLHYVKAHVYTEMSRFN